MEQKLDVQIDVGVAEGRIRPAKEAQVQPTLRVPCEVYSRIVGYLRPVQNWHQGKQQEFSERKTFQVPEEVTSEG